jgi:hypothetical protein
MEEEEEEEEEEETEEAAAPAAARRSVAPPRLRESTARSCSVALDDQKFPVSDSPVFRQRSRCECAAASGSGGDAGQASPCRSRGPSRR